jgi:hypothetical protein
MEEKNERYYSLDEAVALAKTVTPESTDIERVFMDDWIYQGVRQLGVNKESIKSCTIPVHDLGIPKPRDYYMARDLALGNGKGAEVDYIFRGGGVRIHNDIRPKGKFVEVSETADFFHLSSDANQYPVLTARLEYYALPSTEDGDLLIPESYVFALMHFIKYMVTFRNSSPRLKEFKDYWEKEAARVRARNIKPHLLEFKEGVARTYMSMINKPTRDRF